jgi:hypothetical protein
MSPSILSKLLQKLLNGATPVKSAIATMAINTPIARRIGVTRGFGNEPNNTKSTQHPKATSVRSLNNRFFPKIYGKNDHVDT